MAKTTAKKKAATGGASTRKVAAKKSPARASKGTAAATKKPRKQTVAGDSKARKQSMCDAAGRLAAKHGSTNVTRRMIAQELDVSDSLVGHYLGNTEDIKKAAKAAARKLGYTEPSKDEQLEIGKALRAHGPRKPVVAAPKVRRASDNLRRDEDKYGRRATDKKNLGRRKTDRAPLPPPLPPVVPAVAA